jgi:hypothetical protein
MLASGLAATGCAAVALAATTTSAEMKYAAGAKVINTPATSTGYNVSWSIGGEATPKPDVLTKVVLRLAKGTNFDTRARVRCVATADDFRSRGEAACPAKSRIGSGRAQLITGIGPQSQGGPDPVDAKLTAFNAKAAIIIYLKPDLGSPMVIRGTIAADGRTGPGVTPVITLKVPSSPVASFGDAAISSFALGVTPTSARVGGKPRIYAKTPAACPSAKHWQLIATFTYDHQSPQTTKLFSPCKAK